MLAGQVFLRLLGTHDLCLLLLVTSKNKVQNFQKRDDQPFLPLAVKAVGGTHIQGDCPLSPLSNDALWSQPSPLIARMQMEHSRMHDPCIRWAGFCCVEQKMWTHMSINLSSALVKKLSCAQNKFPCFGVKPVILWAQLSQTWITALFTLCETASSVIEYLTVWYNSLVWGYRKLGCFFFFCFILYFLFSFILTMHVFFPPTTY